MIKSRSERKNYNKMIEELIEFPRRKEIIRECPNDYNSKFDRMAEELEDFQSKFLEGDKLSPIGIL